MRVLVRRVASAEVEVEHVRVGSITSGLLVLAGFDREDEEEDLQWALRKLLQLRIFECESGKMNRSIGKDQGILLVSQFTLFGSVRKGSRPSFNQAADPDRGRQLYERFVRMIEESFDGTLQTGVFGGDMRIRAVDDGPVTIWIDSKNRHY